MLTHNNLLALGVVGLLLAALPTFAKPAPPKANTTEAPMQIALIENTGSTNAYGYTLAVASNGNARLNPNGQPYSIVYVPNKLTSKLFADLNAAMPLTKLPVRHGMRSASFGTSTFITYKNQKSPDLTGGGGAQATALRDDIQAIVGKLGIKNMPRHPLPTH